MCYYRNSYNKKARDEVDNTLLQSSRVLPNCVTNAVIARGNIKNNCLVIALKN